jgi:hypothetical protein
MSDSLNGSTKVAGSDILFTAQLDRQTDGIPLSGCTIAFKLTLKNVTILNLTTGLGLTRTINTDDRQVVTGEISASITANIKENSLLKYDWSITAQGRVIRDKSYKGSFTIVGY